MLNAKLDSTKILGTPIVFDYEDVNAFTEEERNLIQSAMQDLNEVAGREIFRYGYNEPATLIIGRKYEDDLRNSHYAGVTHHWGDHARIDLLPRWFRKSRWFQRTRQKNLVLHELGHALGFEHLWNPVSFMFPIAGGWPIPYFLWPAERKRLRTAYGG